MGDGQTCPYFHKLDKLKRSTRAKNAGLLSGAVWLVHALLRRELLLDSVGLSRPLVVSKWLEGTGDNNKDKKGFRFLGSELM